MVKNDIFEPYIFLDAFVFFEKRSDFLASPHFARYIIDEDGVGKVVSDNHGTWHPGPV